MTDFNDLLSKSAAEVHKPPPIPAGRYRTTVVKREFGASAKKQTPLVKFTFKGFDPQADVDSEAWSAFTSHPTYDKEMEKSDDFYITPSALYRVKDFAENCGLDPESIGVMAKVIDECVGCSVVVEFQHTPSNKPGSTDIFANISSYSKA